MKNTETKALETELPDGETLLRHERECVRFFCTTLTSLNNISLEYNKGVLSLVITAAKMAHSLSSPKTDEDAMSTSAANADEGMAFIEKLRGDFSRQVGITAATQSAASNPGTLCWHVEAAVIQAMQNAVAGQQQAYITAQAALTESTATLLALLDVEKTGVSNASDQGKAA